MGGELLFRHRLHVGKNNSQRIPDSQVEEAGEDCLIGEAYETLIVNHAFSEHPQVDLSRQTRFAASGNDRQLNVLGFGTVSYFENGFRFSAEREYNKEIPRSDVAQVAVRKLGAIDGVSFD